MKRPGSWWWSLVVVLALAGCPPADMGEEDAGEEEAEVPFDGETQGGVIPVFEPDAVDGGDVVIDAGQVMVETSCCETRFSIADEEPADAVGVLEGETAVLAGGVPLARTDAGWEATACFPVKASSFYWYRFTSDGGLVDAGPVDLEDGGEETLLIPVVNTVIRASDTEPSFVGADGVRRNFFRAVESCEGLDGGVP